MQMYYCFWLKTVHYEIGPCGQMKFESEKEQFGGSCQDFFLKYKIATYYIVMQIDLKINIKYIVYEHLCKVW
jgi:hypothetical protein